MCSLIVKIGHCEILQRGFINSSFQNNCDDLGLPVSYLDLHIEHHE